jgi:hypothetical protein
VDELRPRRVALGEAVEQPVEMVVRLRPALGGEAGRLVDDDRRLVLVDHQRTDEGGLVCAEQRPHRLLLLRRGIRFGLRRDAHDLARLDPVAGRGALAVEAELPGPRPARDLAEADLGQVALEPAVEADAVILLAHLELADLVGRAHEADRIASRPRNSSSTEPITEAQDIEGGKAVLAALDHQEGLEAEGGEGGEAAEHADREEEPRRLAAAGPRQPAGKQAHQQPAGQVHGQRPPGKARPVARPHQVARPGAERAAEHDDEEVGHIEADVATAARVRQWRLAILPVREADGEGDHAQHGGGAARQRPSSSQDRSLRSRPSTALRAVPLPVAARQGGKGSQRPLLRIKATSEPVRVGVTIR